MIKATAYAPTRILANNAAMIFIGQMLDCLVIDIDEPLFLSFDGRKYLTRSTNVKRFIEKHEFINAFDESMLLSQNEPTFLRAYGWYRKGLVSEDPFDAFLSFWNSIEIVTSKYQPRTEKTKNGSKAQTWESFKYIWGDCEVWPIIIKGDNTWIDCNHATRNKIAHGIADVNIDEVNNVISNLNTLKLVSLNFLREWRKTFEYELSTT